MTRVLITGSADGLGQMVARELIDLGHEVTLHARSESRAQDALRGAPGAAGVLVGDLSSIAETTSIAEQANASGRFDVVVHNAAVGYQERRRIETVDGLAHVFATNSLAPYLLTALIDRPDRLIYLSSGMHLGGDPDLTDLQWQRRRWNGSQAYSDSKLHDAILAFAVARLWPHVRSNAVDPGWVATKMGGPGASRDMSRAPETQVWLATADNPGSGEYYYHRKPHRTHPAVSDVRVQDGFLKACAGLTGVSL
ncbi:SDR family NAD(P)-dependent oxidoreductase [Kibdelosporangium aridum]|uniref:SDR family NAD(P)-dependent oxidoreductase n=1 Tax=Kibdelosporangium aridum TaxID=2030 RepID=UPI0005262438